MGNEVKLYRFRIKGWFLSRIFVTRFAKRGLIQAQFQVSLFTIIRQIQQ